MSWWKLHRECSIFIFFILTQCMFLSVTCYDVNVRNQLWTNLTSDFWLFFFFVFTYWIWISPALHITLWIKFLTAYSYDLECVFYIWCGYNGTVCLVWTILHGYGLLLFLLCFSRGSWFIFTHYACARFIWP